MIVYFNFNGIPIPIVEHVGVVSCLQTLRYNFNIYYVLGIFLFYSYIFKMTSPSHFHMYIVIILK